MIIPGKGIIVFIQFFWFCNYQNSFTLNTAVHIIIILELILMLI